MVKSDKCMGVSQLLGHVSRLPPKSKPIGSNYNIIFVLIFNITYRRMLIITDNSMN